jgi:hypothetical protein
MEVFVLMGSITYEGDMLLGVYASKQEAWDAQGVYDLDRDNSRFDWYNVVRQVVGAPASHV